MRAFRSVAVFTELAMFRNMPHFSDKLSQLASNPGAVTAFDGVPALWWLFAAITVIVRNREIPNSVGKKR